MWALPATRLSSPSSHCCRPSWCHRTKVKNSERRRGRSSEMAGSPLLVILRKAVGGEELGVGADCGGRSLGKGPVRVGKSLGEGRLTGRILQNSGEEGLVGAWERLWLRRRGARGRDIGRCGADGEQHGGDNRLGSSFSSSAGRSAGIDARRNGGGRCLGEGQPPAWGQWGEAGEKDSSAPPSSSRAGWRVPPRGGTAGTTASRSVWCVAWERRGGEENKG